MIRLTASASDHGFTYTLVQSGKHLLTTGNRVVLVQRMSRLGIEDPMHLVQAAESWGVVDIRDEPRSKPRPPN